MNLRTLPWQRTGFACVCLPKRTILTIDQLIRRSVAVLPCKNNISYKPVNRGKADPQKQRPCVVKSTPPNWSLIGEKADPQQNGGLAW